VYCPNHNRPLRCRVQQIAVGTCQALIRFQWIPSTSAVRSSMDPIAHTFTGMALAAAGLRRATPLAPTALLMGVNAPDVDVFTGVMSDYQSIAWRRGWTHGVLALAIWPLVLTGLVLAWDRTVRRRRNPTAAPARAGPLLMLTALAVLSHPTLDWLNNYGLRWLMPFDGRWFYGDALFVIDPWFWLAVGGAAFLTYSQSRRAHVRWAVFGTIATTLIVVNTTVIFTNAADLVPVPAAVVWVAGVAALITLRWRLRDAQPAVLERAAQTGVAIAAAYVVAMLAVNAAARGEVRAVAAARGIVAADVMVAPSLANPFGGDVVVMTRGEYYMGRFRWFRTPRVELDREGVPRPNGAVYEAAAQDPVAHRFLVWARYPAIDVEAAPDGGTLVRFTDIRYRAADRLSGPVVKLH
jgi:inner membrane protein